VDCASTLGDDLSATMAAAAMSRTQASATRRHDRMDDIMPPPGRRSRRRLLVRSQVLTCTPRQMVSALQAAVNLEKN
jgi:hypothetical protein